MVSQDASAVLLLNPALLPGPLAHDPRPPRGAPFSEISPSLNLLFRLESWFRDLPIKTEICKSHVAFWLIFHVVSSESQMIPASKLVLRSCRLLRSAHQLCRAEMLHLLPCSRGGWLLGAGSLSDGLRGVSASALGRQAGADRCHFYMCFLCLRPCQEPSMDLFLGPCSNYLNTDLHHECGVAVLCHLLSFYDKKHFCCLSISPSRSNSA